MSVLLRGGVTTKGNLFHNIVSISNLLSAWKEFKKSKGKRNDVVEFELYLEDNIFEIHNRLVSKTYKHNEYTAFYVYDPKRRHIHKATVTDRIVHQAIFRVLYSIFNKHFIYDSYSSRKLRGTHLGVERSYKSCRKASKNWKKKVHVLKCDVRKFFDSIDHGILFTLIKKEISCPKTLELILLILKSFEKTHGKGLPLGNVTSQLFANIYLNELDQFMKHSLKIKYYFRYCDDFIIIHEDRNFLSGLIQQIRYFLKDSLVLDLHPYKVEIRSLRCGIDFLGYVVLPRMIVLRTRTKQRIIRKMKGGLSPNIMISYLGLLSHCRNRKLRAFIGRFL